MSPRGRHTVVPTTPKGSERVKVIPGGEWAEIPAGSKPRKQRSNLERKITVERSFVHLIWDGIISSFSDLWVDLKGEVA